MCYRGKKKTTESKLGYLSEFLSHSGAENFKVLPKSVRFFWKYFWSCPTSNFEVKPTNSIFDFFKIGQIPAMTAKMAIYRKICKIWLQKCSNPYVYAQCGYFEKKIFEVGQLQNCFFDPWKKSYFWIFEFFGPKHGTVRGSCRA